MDIKQVFKRCGYIMWIGGWMAVFGFHPLTYLAILGSYCSYNLLGNVESR